MPKDEDSSRKKGKRGKDHKNGTAAAVDDDGAEEEMQQLLKDGVWKAMMHEDSGRTYYYHTTTRQTCWNLKKEILKQRKAAVSAGSGGMAEDSAPAKGETTIETRKLKVIQKEEGNEVVQSAPEGSDAAAAVAGGGREEEEESRRDASGSGQILVNVPPATAQSSGRQKGGEDHTPVPCGESRMALVQADEYRDPLERLMEETRHLEQLMASSGSSQAMALEFQRSYEALSRTNKALTVQMVKMKQEYDAMTMALKDANIKVYEKDLALRELQGHARAVSKEDETSRTLAFLREQNQELTRQVGELTVALSRGFNELTYQRLMTSGVGAVSPDAMAANPVQLNQPQQSIGEVIDCILNNPLTQKSICITCSRELEKLRLALLSDEERVAALSSSATETAVGAHHANYIPTPSSPPAFNRVGHPATRIQGANGGPVQQQRLLQKQQERPDLCRPESVCGGAQIFPARATSPSPQHQANNAQYVYSGAGGALQHPHEFSSGTCDRPSWGFPAGTSDTYADHFPKVHMSHKSESRVSAMSAAPVFGGFRIRPSY